MSRYVQSFPKYEVEVRALKYTRSETPIWRLLYTQHAALFYRLHTSRGTEIPFLCSPRARELTLFAQDNKSSLDLQMCGTGTSELEKQLSRMNGSELTWLLAPLSSLACRLGSVYWPGDHPRRVPHLLLPLRHRGGQWYYLG